VPELAAPARWEDGRYTMSALTTYSESRHDPQVAARLPLLVAAARELGALQIQNRATWAGNIANASPAADGVPALLAYDAVIELASARGRRWVALADYFTGYKQTLRMPDELIVAITAQAPAAGARHYWRKVGTRKLQAISKVVAAGVLETDAQGVVTRARLAIGSVAPIPLRARRVEEAVTGQRLGAPTTEAALRGLAGDIAPIDDVRSTRDYRLRVAANLVRAFLTPS
jgi:CO/xanthine dehydrogenase FAD-binding subunit